MHVLVDKMCVSVGRLACRQSELVFAVPPPFKRAGALRATPALLMTRNMTKWSGVGSVKSHLKNTSESAAHWTKGSRAVQSDQGPDKV